MGDLGDVRAALVENACDCGGHVAGSEDGDLSHVGGSLLLVVNPVRMHLADCYL
ncbi:hypothetical protein ACFPRL_21110 [Pseudoclavibacter helvolus]